MRGVEAAVAAGRVEMTSRPLAEYRLCLGLRDGELLRGPVLDCSGGASSFAAEARALGADVTSADPVYSLSPERLAALTATARERLIALAERVGDTLDFSWSGSWEAHLKLWDGSAEAFLRDYTADRERNTGLYVAGGLPRLPFPDGRFGLTLCSFLVFTFPGLLDPFEALRDLVRVTAPGGEVRVTPLQDAAGDPYPELETLRVRLAETGVETEVRPIAYSLNPRQTTMLVLRRG
ncbi:methyltransferase domain-containing protein [Streptomyces sp. NPDC050504]|uniref:methyltransferase domain-containing protein n=1 Tax=Streptomyces sp. NPDC050504 TaxID=3365618 RepID=UPI0037B4BAD4